MTEVDAAEAAEQLRRLLTAIAAGEVTASEGQRAYLAGGLDTLERLARGFTTE
jgi:hypothetical protein